MGKHATLGLVALLAGGILTVAGPGTGARLAPAHPAPPAQAAVVLQTIREADLWNGRYELPDIGVFQLRDGAFEARYGPGASEVNRVAFVAGTVGDLTGNGGQDAAVVLTVNTGGSGQFRQLVAILNLAGTREQLPAVPLGDRVLVEALAIDERAVRVRLLTHGPDDPLCCPTVAETQVYRLGLALTRSQ
jgi:hypothetical protein